MTLFFYLPAEDHKESEPLPQPEEETEEALASSEPTSPKGGLKIKQEGHEGDKEGRPWQWHQAQASAR